MTCADVSRPSPSALRVAQMRAVHQLLDEPVVFPDPLALPLLGAEAQRALRDDPYQLNDPFARSMRAGIVARSRYAEDALARAVVQGVAQYVVLGAGLDTFAARNPHGAALRVFEVDHPDTQRRKRALLADLGRPLPGAPRFVALDLRAGQLLESLCAAGFDPRRPAFISCLGVTPYLADTAVLALLDELAALPAGSGIAFDYRVAPRLLSPLEQVMQAFSAQAFAAQGEPWLSAFEPEGLRAALHRQGWTSVDDLGPQELNRLYFHRRRDGLQIGSGGFRWACAWR
ncbi:class I SAM-dependent methyltransferase [Azohydromonas caseinilytica]|uniref:S-adenosyl-L-methionine-dependent methyltransferase n=1 Tax=Azohydromonas caseinilytica TaxID=2728836 RepID=A0A848FLW7_9BURK|nr:class I SAM-dependent methyltransferase [Azohydromonas caseinilytica]NML18781.1 class I SAM-dependent methyltransferase [Azohydromonas caseinilytica]